MKKIILLGIVLSIYILSATPEFSQDEKNITFLKELDKNLLTTIDVLVAFNNIANNMVDVEGVDLYRNFLMEMTLECGKLRNSIESALAAEPEEREETIALLIITLRSDLDLQPSELTAEKDKRNREQIESYEKELRKSLSKLRTEILRQEQNVKDGNSITKTYLNVHSQHYIFSLLSDYLGASEFLSKENRDILLKIAKSIIDSV